MSRPSHTETETCDYCGLPLGRPLWRRATAQRRKDETDASTTAIGGKVPHYCCVGCRIAAAVTNETGEAGAIRWTLVKLGFAGFFAMNVMMFTMALWSSDVYGPQEQTEFSEIVTSLLRYLTMLFALPVLFLLGQPLVENAIEAAKRRTLSTDFLLLAGVLAAYGYSAISVFRGDGPIYFEVGCAILVLVMAGRWLEATGRMRATHALDALEHFLPRSARVLRNCQETIIPLADLDGSETVRVLPGERFPSDGRIIQGSTSVDQQLVTGESWPVSRSLRDTVCGGTLNLDGAVVMKLTAAPSAGTISRLIAAVHAARNSKGRYERLAERASTLFFPIIAATALAAFGWHTWRHGLDRGILVALSVTLIACPCSLALATPMAVWAALGRAAEKQIVLKGGEFLERLSAIRAVRIDKTGTLTTGEPRVVQFVPVESQRATEILNLAAAAASTSTHAFSRAIAELAPSCHQSVPAAAKSTVGQGVTAQLAGENRTIYLGSLQFLESAGLRLPASFREACEKAINAGSPVVLIGWEGLAQGLFVFSETLRPGSAEFLLDCRRRGLDCAVLTGDHLERGRQLERELSVAVLAGLLPEQKLEHIRAMRQAIGPVAMIGDGINDAPALALADVGIALGCGTDVSRDSADVCLMSNDLGRIPWLLDLAGATVHTIRFNLFWAFAYNCAGVGLALTGALNPIAAALCMVISSACVVGTSLRLTRFESGSGQLDARRQRHLGTDGVSQPVADLQRSSRGMLPASHTSAPEKVEILSEVGG